MTGFKCRLIRALANLAGALIVVLGAVLFIRRGWGHFYDHWQEPAFLILMVVSNSLAGWLGLSFARGQKEKPAQSAIAWGFILFGFLYLSCALLCERLSTGMLNYEAWRNLGLILTAAGWGLRLWAIATLGELHSRLVTIQNNHRLLQSGPYRRLRHPSYLGLLLIYAGAPMVFGSWFPLLAMPGVFVALKWRMDDEEELLKSHFGCAYEAYIKGSWRLLPGIY